MYYAYNNEGTFTKIVSLKGEFPKVSFPEQGPNSAFLSDNGIVKINAVDSQPTEGQISLAKDIYQNADGYWVDYQIVATQTVLTATSICGGRVQTNSIFESDSPQVVDGVYMAYELRDKSDADTWISVRDLLKEMLANTDWRDLPSYPGADQAAWRTYRQALRDVPQTYANAVDVVLPTEPSA